MKYKNKDQYNVYSQKIDPTNQMPAVANNQPAPGQSVPLETNRVKSTIPKAGLFIACLFVHISACLFSYHMLQMLHTYVMKLIAYIIFI